MSHIPRVSNYQLLVDLIKDPERKSFFRMVKEILEISLSYKKFPRYYFSRFIFKKDIDNIHDFFDNKFYVKLIETFNDLKGASVLDNKLYYDLFYKPLNIPTPKILMFNHKNMFTIEGQSRITNNINDFKQLLIHIFDKNPSYDSIFIKKTYGSYGGDKMYKFYKQDLESNNKKLESIYKNVIQTAYIFQETVQQHPQMNKINPASVNTIRIDTFTNNEGKVDIMSGFLRMSTNNGPFDNNCLNGLIVGVDILTGQLKKIGYIHFSSYGVKRFSAHPMTNTVFENQQIPYFEEAKNLVKQAARQIPLIRLVGWDVAIGKNGPILIEGNSYYGIGANDLTYGGYKSNPVFKNVLEEFYQNKN